MAFDYALLATGSVYASGVKPPADVLVTRAQRLQQFANIRSKVGFCGSGGADAAGWSCCAQEIGLASAA